MSHTVNYCYINSFKKACLNRHENLNLLGALFPGKAGLEYTAPEHVEENL